jgi:CBS domain-containing protein
MRRLSDIICNQYPLIMPQTETVQAACQQMSELRTGSVLVVDENGSLVGIFTGRDAVCGVLAAGKDASKTALGEVMTRNPMTMSPNETAIDALRLMWEWRIPARPSRAGRKNFRRCFARRLQR